MRVGIMTEKKGEGMVRIMVSQKVEIDKKRKVF